MTANELKELFEAKKDIVYNEFISKYKTEISDFIAKCKLLYDNKKIIKFGKYHCWPYKDANNAFISDDVTKKVGFVKNGNIYGLGIMLSVPFIILEDCTIYQSGLQYQPVCQIEIIKKISEEFPKLYKRLNDYIDTITDIEYEGN